MVFPNEFGAKKHPLFFLECLFKEKFNKVQEIDYKKDKQDKSNFEEVEEYLNELEKANKTVSI
jgi:hypothetical protein